MIPSLLTAGALILILETITLVAAKAPLTGAVIFVYHRFGENDVPSTNIRLEQFEAHLEELKNGSYTVLDLPTIAKMMIDGEPLPDRTIAITIDDAYSSVFFEAFPRLQEAGFPFTVFVATDLLDSGGGGRYMTWDQIRQLRDAGVTIGAHTAGHEHLAAIDEEEVIRTLERSKGSFKRELGEVPALFAYPYGEMSLKVKKIIQDQGFLMAFGQHSGVAEAGLDLFYQPRFALNENYGALSRFRLAANSLPMGARDIVPREKTLIQNPPSFGFTIDSSVKSINQLNCFASHESTPARLERLGERRFEVRLNTPFPPGRGRFNCTARTEDNRWRWFGEQFYIPRP